MSSLALKKPLPDEARPAAADARLFVIMRVERQLFGIPVEQVREVLKAQKVAPIPLAPPQVAGAFNLRGRIVTVIDLRQRLLLGAGDSAKQSMLIVLEHGGEWFALMADAVGEALALPAARIEPPPPHLDAHWREVAVGVFRLEEALLLIVDVSALLAIRT